MSHPSERRRHARFPVAWAVRLWVDDQPLLGRAEDASRNGLWVTIAPTSALRLGKICWIDVIAKSLDRSPWPARFDTSRDAGLETLRPVPIAGLAKD